MQEGILAVDAKNYHVWAYRSVLWNGRLHVLLWSNVQRLANTVRYSVLTTLSLCCAVMSALAALLSQWLVARFSLWSSELPFVDSLLDADVRNNSAWNYRYFVHDKQQIWNENTVKREVESARTQQNTLTAPHNTRQP